MITPQARPIGILITTLRQLHFRKIFDMVDTRSGRVFRGWHWCGRWHIHGIDYRGIKMRWWQKRGRWDSAFIISFLGSARLWRQKWWRWWRYLWKWWHSWSQLPFRRRKSCGDGRRWGRIPHAWWGIRKTDIRWRMWHPWWWWWQQQYWRKRLIYVGTPPKRHDGNKPWSSCG